MVKPAPGHRRPRRLARGAILDGREAGTAGVAGRQRHVHVGVVPRGVVVGAARDARRGEVDVDERVVRVLDVAGAVDRAEAQGVRALRADA